jgi:hypothetical protein
MLFCVQRYPLKEDLKIGIFEDLRFEWGKIVQLKQHVERFLTFAFIINYKTGSYENILLSENRHFPFDFNPCCF